MKRIIVTYATTKELVELDWEDIQVAYLRTGVGKTKSAYYLSQAIDNLKPDVVINVGTAGTESHAVGDIFVCHHFLDRDMKKLANYGIEFEIDLPAIPDFLPECLKRQEGTCNTGDTFVTGAENLSEDVIDMEAYAQAFVCQSKNTPFIAVKCITDIIGQNSVEIWEDGITKASKALYRYLNGKEKK